VTLDPRDPPSTTTKVSSVVVVLNFNGRDDTLRCVASIVDHTGDHHVLVVDNGSHDDVLASVERRWPEVSTLQLPRNLGFSGGMNRGLDWARRAGADVVTVLNNDTVVPQGALDVLVARAAGAAVAVSPVVRYRGTQRTWFAGGGVDPADALPRHLDDDEVAALRAVDPDRPYRTQLLAGCCITAATATWTTVGAFDERFFLNFEDSEWSLRAERSGIALEVVPEATIEHSVSASFTGAYSYLGGYYYARNSLLYARLAGTGLRTTARMFRHRVLRAPWHAARDEGVREGARRSVLVLAAVVSHGARRYGRAPRWVENAASRWATEHASK